MNDFFTVKEFADYLQLHKVTVYRMLRRGELQGIRISNGTNFRIPKSYVFELFPYPDGVEGPRELMMSGEIPEKKPRDLGPHIKRVKAPKRFKPSKELDNVYEAIENRNRKFDGVPFSKYKNRFLRGKKNVL